uniref:Uncharacterized protein LOC105128485 n=2 Tax=Rhizophora mucronata TaxID=61149 RepID=A0A2P2JT65_RHIMU
MEKHQYGISLIFCIIVSLGLVSFVSCIIAEAKKAKKEGVRFNGKLCYVPESAAFGFGIAAMICLVLAQAIGSLLIRIIFRLRDGRHGCRAKRPWIAIAVGALSWISFGLALILLSTATSMSRRQEYGKGWLDQECYLVKNGVYSGSGVLVLVTIAATLSSSVLATKEKQIEQNSKVNSQIG